MQGLVGCFYVQRTGWTAVFEIHDVACEFCPKLLGKTSFCKDRLNAGANDAVGTLCDAILFWHIRCRLFVLDSNFLSQIFHLFAVFAAPVGSNRFDTSAVLFEFVAENKEGISHFLSGLMYLVASSIKIRKYLSSPMDVGLIHTNI